MSLKPMKSAPDTKETIPFFGELVPAGFPSPALFPYCSFLSMF
ncbi:MULTISPECIES: hypothetical protein [Providencia]|nr:hypothetical protein [Providencia huaxiensis]